MKKKITWLLALFSMSLMAQNFNDQIARIELGDSNFGKAVAINQGTLAVGEPDYGSVFIYEIDGNGETFVQELFPDNVRAFNPTFGDGVGVSKDYVVAGYPAEGKIYVYQLIANVWTQVQVLSDPNNILENQFGSSISIKGDVLVVGVEKYQSGDGIIKEAAHIYELNSGTWVETDFIIENSVGRRFVSAVATDGVKVVMGSYYNGTAYVYQKNGSTWSKEQTLTSPSASFDSFGVSVAIENNTVVVGNDADENGIGSAYVYEKNVEWALTNTLTGSNSISFDGFGSSVGVSNNTIAVASYRGLENSKTIAYTFTKQQNGSYSEDNAFETLSGAITESSSMAISQNQLALGFGASGSLNILSVNTGVLPQCAENTSIPDPNFEQALLDQNIDTDGELNGLICNEDAIAILELDIAGKNINDITGIEAFINLISLKVQQNNLVALDLASNADLETLWAFRNQISDLDITYNTKLKNLLLGVNQLTTLDVSTNPVIETVSVSRNQLSSFIANDSSILRGLDLSYNQLTSLDFSQSTGLRVLNCRGNQLDYLNIKNGNNLILSAFKANANPSLSCIEVDDVDFANSQPLPLNNSGSMAGWQKDVTSSYSLDCVNNLKSIEIVISEPSVVLYPNPIIDGTLNWKAHEKVNKIEIFRLSGQLVLSQVGNNKSINLSNLNKGMYIVQLSVGSEIFVNKIDIQ